jgi:hypothetical protein
MNDFFAEKIVKRSITKSDRIMQVLTGIVAVVAIFLLNIVPMYFGLNILVVTALLSVGIGYPAYAIIISYDVEYEYCLTNDELSIDKIISKRKRKHLFSTNCKDFKAIGPVSDIMYARLKNSKEKIYDYTSGKNSDQEWFFSVRHKGIDKTILIEYDERFMKVFRRFNPRSFVE